jgi:hypothetical protein
MIAQCNQRTDSFWAVALATHTPSLILTPSLVPNRTQIEKMKKRLQITLNGTKFAGCDMVAVSARPGGAESMAAGESASASHSTYTAESMAAGESASASHSTYTAESMAAGESASASHSTYTAESMAAGESASASHSTYTERSCVAAAGGILKHCLRLHSHAAAEGDGRFRGDSSVTPPPPAAS